MSNVYAVGYFYGAAIRVDGPEEKVRNLCTYLADINGITMEVRREGDDSVNGPGYTTIGRYEGDEESQEYSDRVFRGYAS